MAIRLTARQRAARRWSPSLSMAIIARLLADPANVAEQVPLEIGHIAHYTLTGDQVATAWADLRENHDHLSDLLDGTLTPAEVFDEDELKYDPYESAIGLASMRLHDACEVILNGCRTPAPPCDSAPAASQSGASA